MPKFPDVSTVAKDDFLAAFRRVAGGAGCIELSQVEYYMLCSCLLLCVSYSLRNFQVKDVLKFALDTGVDPLQVHFSIYSFNSIFSRDNCNILMPRIRAT